MKINGQISYSQGRTGKGAGGLSPPGPVGYNN